MNEILLYAIAGFIAQLVDGVLGMGYGVSATSLLLSLGVAPAVSSASVHTAETVATGFSAYSHYRYGNVMWSLARRLLIPGVIGAVIGAYILTRIPGETVRPFIADYLLLMGGLILVKALRRRPHAVAHAHIAPLARARGYPGASRGSTRAPRATRTGGRLLRCHRRWRLGPDRRRHSARAGKRAADDDRVGQLRGVFRDAPGIDHVSSHHRTRRVEAHRRPRARW